MGSHFGLSYERTENTEKSAVSADRNFVLTEVEKEKKIRFINIF